MAVRFLKIAVIYIMIGSAMGVVMGITHEFRYAPVHAHVNLLGWASLAIFSFIYHLYPAAARTTLATLHFWLHNLGLPVFMVSLFLLLSGHSAAEAGVAIGAIAVLAGIQMFGINLLLTLRNQDDRQALPANPPREHRAAGRREAAGSPQP